MAAETRPPSATIAFPILAIAFVFLAPVIGFDAGAQPPTPFSLSLSAAMVVIMKARIEEGIDSSPRTKARVTPTPAAVSVASATGWSMDDLILFFKNFFPDRSDEPEDAPP